MSGDTGRPSSSEVASEAEDTRAHLASTLEQLRTNLRPENVMEEVVSNARAGASTIADNLVGLTKAYPLPAILIATGAALIMGVTGKGLGRSRKGGDSEHLPRAATLSRPKRFEPAPGRVAMPQTEPTTSLADAASSVKQGTRDSLASGRARSTDMVTSLRNQASDAYDATSSSARDAMQSLSHSLPHSAGEAKSKLSTLFDEQPLVLGAIGLAIGAAIGAALPMTETEDSLMGSTAHRFRDSATDAARQEVDGIRAAAGEAIDNVRHSAEDNLRTVVDKAGDSLGGPRDV